MAKTIYTDGNFYHIYNRGVNREPIFFEERNWGFFIQKVRHYFKPAYVAIVAYCLMPNHYHLLVQVLCDDFSRKVMQPFGTSYTKAINKEQDRVGPLFQGRFKGVHVDSDAYLLHLSRYIHRNPVEAKLVPDPAVWRFSSYQDYVGLRGGTLPQNEIVLSQFKDVAAYAEYVEQPYDDGDIQHLKLD